MIRLHCALLYIYMITINIVYHMLHNAFLYARRVKLSRTSHQSSACTR